MERIKHIAVIGAGLMGHGLAQIFAVKGYRVSLMDIKNELLTRALENIRSNLTIMADSGMGSLDDMETVMARIKTAVDLKEAASEAHFVVEAVLENLELKQKIFGELDRICPKETILATNTSVISISEIAEKSKNRDRIVGTHFWNPPHLIPLVEVIKAKHTSKDTLDRTMRLMANIGKKPVYVKKDVPGFLANRLQHALWREAISIVEQGIADPEEVDRAVKNSFGLRLPVLGPIENADLVGLDLTFAIHDYVLKHIEDAHGPSPILKEKVDKGELGLKTGKGFKEWPAQKANLLQQRLVNHLLKWTREHVG